MLEWGVFVVLVVAGAAITAVVSRGRLWRPVADLLLIGFALRVIGSQLRYWVIYSVYNGYADAERYYSGALFYADAFWSGDIFYSSVHPSGWGEWWGTRFFQLVVGVVVTFIGPSKRGAFVALSLLGFVGVVLMVKACMETFGSFQQRRIAGLMFLLPTLWFWPSSIGKESIVLLAMGLVTYGYVGRRNVLRWIPLGLGLFLSFAIRPHVAGVLVVAMVTAEFLRPAQHWSFRRVVGAVVVFGMAVVLLGNALQELGLAGADAEGLNEFVDRYNKRTLYGGSTISPGGNLSALALAPINVLMRPFIFEAHNGPALASALELTFLWAMIVVHRRRFVQVIGLWRRSELTRFLFPALALYTLMLGLAFSNLGILARQRSIVMPGLVLLLALAWPQRGPPPGRSG